MRPERPIGWRVVAWACALAVLVAALSPASVGLPPAILPPPGPTACEPAPIAVLDGGAAARPPELVVVRGVPARAPPLA
jgi:hypothetical protein